MLKKFNKTLFQILLWLNASLSVAQSFQSGCPNANFSMGNLTGWVGYTGNYSNPGQTMGIVNGRHTIINSQGLDPNTCGGLQMIPPGHNKSLRLGNAITGAQGEKVSYQISVSQSNALFIYKYAVVLQNPGHSPSSQPTFQARILNSSGQQIGGNCGIYTVYGGQPGQNFQTCGGQTWLPWTVVGLNLTPYIGQTINVEFTTRDCSLSGHYGYAYVVAECMPLMIDVDYCVGSNQIQLTAPSGFQSYLWLPGGASSQSITISNPIQNQQFTCTMQSFSNQGNCTVTSTAQAIPTSINASFTYGSACPWTPIQFNSTSIVTPNSVGGIALANGGASSWYWDFGDNSTLTGNNPSIHMNPPHIYQNAGTYVVTHTTTTQAGCSNTVSQVITISPPPNINFSLNNSCINQTVNFVNQSNNATPTNYIWNFGNGSPTTTLLNPSYTYTLPGSYNVSLIASNQGACIDTLIQAITIYPLPTVTAGPNQTICSGSSATLIGGGATSYTWNNGVINNIAFTPLVSNTYQVTGIDVNNCINTATTSITINPVPEVSNQVATLCSDIASGLTLADDIDGPSASTYNITAINSNGLSASAGTPLVANGVINSNLIDDAWTNTTNAPVDVIYTIVPISAVGCQGTPFTVTLTINPLPVFNVLDAVVCAGEYVTLKGNPSSFSYSWDNGITDNVPFVPSYTDTYNVVATNTITGCVQYSNALVTVHPNPIADFIQTWDELMAIFTNTSSGALNYYWNMGDGGIIITSENVSYTYEIEDSTSYIITLIAETEFGCIDTISRIITTPLVFYIPNAFTPDGNEYNNVFTPIFSNKRKIENYSLSIYNRWGEIVFETKDVDFGWDGFYKNKMAESGTYIWQLQFTNLFNSKKELINGHLNLLR